MNICLFNIDSYDTSEDVLKDLTECEMKIISVPLSILSDRLFEMQWWIFFFFQAPIFAVCSLCSIYGIWAYLSFKHRTIYAST